MRPPSGAPSMRHDVERRSTLWTPWVHELLFDDEIARVPDAVIRHCIITSLRDIYPLPEISGEELYRRFEREIERIRYEELKELVQTYLPRDIWMNHGLLPWYGKRHSDFTDPVDIVRPQTELSKNDEAQFYFESARDLSLADLSLSIVTERRRSDTRVSKDWSERGRTARDRYEIFNHLTRIGLLEENSIAPAHLWSEHELIPEHRVIRIRDAEKHTIFEKPSDLTLHAAYSLGPLYKGTLIRGDQRVPVYIAVRRKGIIQTIAKALYMTGADERTMSMRVPDRIGIRFLFRTEEEWVGGIRTILRRLCHGALRKIQAGKRLVNEFAYEGLVLAKDGSIVRAQEIEVQCMPIEHHANIAWSHGEEHHLRYHIRWYTKDDVGILPWLFPHTLYGIDWRDPALLKRMHDHVVMRGR